MALGNKNTGTGKTGTGKKKFDIEKTNAMLNGVKVVRFTEYEKELNDKTTMYGFVTIDFNGVYINGVKLIATVSGDDVHYWLSFPQEKGKDGQYYNVCGLSSDIDADIITSEVVNAIDKM